MKKLFTAHRAEREIFILLQGGLGNQLFQLSAGLALHNSTTQSVKFDDTFLSVGKRNLIRAKSTPRDLAIGSILSENEQVRTGLAGLALHRFASVLDSSIWINESRPDENLLQRVSHKTKVVNGYFQRFDIPESVKAELILRFSNSEEWSPIINSTENNDLAIHIRFGDYRSNPTTRKYHGLTDISYFSKSAKLLISRNDFEKLVIYSDDPEAAYREFCSELGEIKIPIIRHHPISAIHDLTAMTSSKGLIMSNSTFSWWAAWFKSLRSTKNIVFPTPWYSEPSRAEFVLIGTDWEKVERTFSIQ